MYDLQTKTDKKGMKKQKNHSRQKNPTDKGQGEQHLNQQKKNQQMNKQTTQNKSTYMCQTRRTVQPNQEDLNKERQRSENRKVVQPTLNGEQARTGLALTLINK